MAGRYRSVWYRYNVSLLDRFKGQKFRLVAGIIRVTFYSGQLHQMDGNVLANGYIHSEMLHSLTGLPACLSWRFAAGFCKLQPFQNKDLFQ